MRALIGDEIIQSGEPAHDPRCPVVPPVMSANVPPAWASEINDYLLNLVCSGRPAATIRLRHTQLTNLARSLGSAPAAVTSMRLMAWMGGQPWRRETRRSYRAAVRGFFAWECKVGRLTDDPTVDLPVIPEECGPARPVPDHVLHAALLAASPRVALMLRLAAEAGLRRGEVARIHVNDVQDGPRLLVHGKGARNRVIPITPELTTAIVTHAAASGWLFPGSDAGHLSPDWVGILCAHVLPDGWSLHCCRHRFASAAYRATRNLRAVQLLLGHASVATTQRYLAVDDDELRAAMMGAAA